MKQKKLARTCDYPLAKQKAQAGSSGGTCASEHATRSQPYENPSEGILYHIPVRGIREALIENIFCILLSVFQELHTLSTLVQVRREESIKANPLLFKLMFVFEWVYTSHAIKNTSNPRPLSHAFRNQLALATPAGSRSKLQNNMPTFANNYVSAVV